MAMYGGQGAYGAPGGDGRNDPNMGRYSSSPVAPVDGGQMGYPPPGAGAGPVGSGSGLMPGMDHAAYRPQQGYGAVPGHMGAGVPVGGGGGPPLAHGAGGFGYGDQRGTGMGVPGGSVPHPADRGMGQLMTGEWPGMNRPGSRYGRGPPPGIRGAVGGGYRQHGPPAELRFPAVRLRGLPFVVREYEVAMFLELDPIDIIFCLKNGRKSGEAIVVLSSLEEMDAALRKNRNYLQSRYIEIFEARKIDYYRAVCDSVLHGENESSSTKFRDRKHSHDQSYSSRERSRSPTGTQKHGGATPGTTQIVRLRGLPFTAREEEIVNFFNDESLELSEKPTRESVTLALGVDGRPSGMAFVQFKTPEDATKALVKDKGSIGTRYIELFLATEDERARWLPVR